MQGLYTTSQLRKKMGELGFPNSRPTFYKYVKRGIIQPPKTTLPMENGDWRFYTEEEVQENLQRVAQFRSSIDTK